MKTLKKLLVAFAALIIAIILTASAATAIVVGHWGTTETIVKTKTCYSDGTHCTTSTSRQ